MTENNLIMNIMFYLFAVILIASVLCSIFSKKIIYSILWAISVFICTAGLFWFLGNEYNSVVQFMIYCTAVPILLAFAIMFTDYYKDNKIHITQKTRLYGSFLATGLCILLVFFVLNQTSADLPYEEITVIADSTQNMLSITRDIFTKYMYAFELIALVILVIIAGVSNHDE